MDTMLRRIRAGALIIVVLASGSRLCLAQQQQAEPESIWVEEETAGEHQLKPKAIERILRHLADSDPQQAERLRRLRQENPAEFSKAVRELMRDKWKKRMEPKPAGPRGRAEHGPLAGLPGAGGGGRGKRPMDVMRMLREHHAEYIEWLQENLPEEAEKLERLRKQQPDFYLSQLMLSRRKYGRIMRASQEKPELAEILKADMELKAGRDELLDELCTEADEQRRAELTEDLRAVLSRRFDLIIRRKQIAYEQLREKLERLREHVKQSQADLDKWSQSKQQQVEQRLAELVGRTEEFNWD